MEDVIAKTQEVLPLMNTLERILEYPEEGILVTKLLYNLLCPFVRYSTVKMQNRYLICPLSK